MSNNESLISIQYLRAIAAAMVLFEHLGDKSQQVGGNILGFYQHGYIGVDVFFVISGFIMSFIYSKSPVGAGSVSDFWRRRFVRIMPLYWLLTAAALAIFLVAPDKINSSGGTTVVLRSFLLVPGQGERFLIANGWTLSYEMLFYAVFSLSLFLSSKRLGFGLAISVVGFLGFSNAAGFFWPAPIISEFAFGIVVFLVYRRWGRVAWAPVFALGGAAGLLFQAKLEAALPGARFLTAGIPATLLVFGMVSFEKELRKIRLRWLARLGDSSYSMYLFNPFVLKAMGMVFAYAGLGNYGLVVEAFFWFCAAVIVFGTGHLVFLHLEIPLIRFSRKIVLGREETKTPSGEVAARR